MSDKERVAVFRRELTEARQRGVPDGVIAEVVVRMASYGEISPIDLRAVLAEHRPQLEWSDVLPPVPVLRVADPVERFARAAQIVELWERGVPVVELAGAVGMTPVGLRTEVQRLRVLGFVLPVRRVARKVAA